MRTSAARVLIYAAILALGCDVVRERREVHTLANLQALAARLQRLAENDAAVRREDFDSVVDEYFGRGEDPWGNPILFVPASACAGSTFLLISTGSDGALDFAEAGKYFELDRPPDLSAGKGRDIVLKSSRVLRHGAHK